MGLKNHTRLIICQTCNTVHLRQSEWSGQPQLSSWSGAGDADIPSQHLQTKLAPGDISDASLCVKTKYLFQIKLSVLWAARHDEAVYRGIPGG